MAKRRRLELPDADEMDRVAEKVRRRLAKDPEYRDAEDRIRHWTRYLDELVNEQERRALLALDEATTERSDRRSMAFFEAGVRHALVERLVDRVLGDGDVPASDAVRALAAALVRVAERLE